MDKYFESLVVDGGLVVSLVSVHVYSAETRANTLNLPCRNIYN